MATNPDTPIKTITDVFGIWTNARQMSKDTRIDIETLRKARQRSSLSPKHWADVVDAARRKGIEIAPEQLLVMHGSRRPRRPKARVAI